MNDDYLADRRGPPDPEVARLEGLLADARYQPGRLKVPKPSRRALAVGLSLAASLAVVASGGLAAYLHATALPSWSVRLSGPWGEESDHLELGAWLQTDAQTQAEVKVADIGRLQLAPGSRLRLSATGPAGHRLELQKGSLTAKVTAPPRLFVVDTPTARAVDLGCEYQLSALEGSTTLKVLKGVVNLEGRGQASTVLAGFTCASSRLGGPGLPLRVGAAPELEAAVRRFDQGENAAAEAVLAASTRADAMTDWHLFRRVGLDEREKVAARLGELLGPGECQAPGLADSRSAQDDCWDVLVDDYIAAQLTMH